MDLQEGLECNVAMGFEVELDLLEVYRKWCLDSAADADRLGWNLLNPAR